MLQIIQYKLQLLLVWRLQQ